MRAAGIGARKKGETRAKHILCIMHEPCLRLRGGAAYRDENSNMRASMFL